MKLKTIRRVTPTDRNKRYRYGCRVSRSDDGTWALTLDLGDRTVIARRERKAGG